MNWAEFCGEFIPQPKTVAVEALTGSSGYGDVHAAAVDVTPCFVDDTRRRVRVQTGDAAGEEQTSSTTVLMPPETVCPAGSWVTYNGRRTKVMASSFLDAHGHDLPEHVEISLE